MKFIKWIGILASVILTICGFLTWVTVPSRQIVVSGVDTSAMNLGKPAYFHFLLVIFFIVFSLIQKLWAKRANLPVAALNIAWAIRNYFLLTACAGGECPEKHPAIYVIAICSLIMLVAVLFPDIKLQAAQKTDQA